jgi:menaquinone-dependent protoporphyrinogen oxidase
MRVLITAASKHGATDDIARLIAGSLSDAGIDTVVAAPEQITSLGIEEADAVVIGSAVYLGRWMAPARKLVERYAAALADRPVWLFSSGPTNDPPKPEDDPSDVADLMRLAHAREHRTFPGRLDRHGLGLGERLAVAAAHAPDGDFRSPAEIGEWASHIARSLEALAPVA